jgi:hypothetical protein
VPENPTLAGTHWLLDYCDKITSSSDPDFENIVDGGYWNGDFLNPNLYTYVDDSVRLFTYSNGVGQSFSWFASGEASGQLHPEVGWGNNTNNCQ